MARGYQETEGHDLWVTVGVDIEFPRKKILEELRPKSKIHDCLMVPNILQIARENSVVQT